MTSKGSGMETRVDLEHVKKEHALDLPDWGAWSARYVGGALIADHEREIVMEFPFAVRTIGYPLITAGPGGSEKLLRQWRTDAAMTLWEWRLLQATMTGETSPPDEGGGFIEYAPVGEDALIVSARFFKNTPGVSQRYIFDFCAGQAPVKPRLERAFRDGDVWAPAQDYAARDAQYIAPIYRLRPGVRKYSGASDGEALFLNFKDKTVTYRFELNEPLDDARIAIRYAVPRGDEDQPLVFTVDSREFPLTLPVNGRFATGHSPDDWWMHDAPVGPLAAGAHELRIAPRDDWKTRRPAHVLIDGFLICRSPYDWRAENAWRPVVRENGGVFVERDIDSGTLLLRNENLRTGKHFALVGQGPRVYCRLFKTADVAEGLDAVGPYWWCHGTYQSAKGFGRKTVLPGQGGDSGAVQASDAVWADLSICDLYVHPGREDRCRCVVVRDEDKDEALKRVKALLQGADATLASRRKVFAQKRYSAPGKKYAAMAEHLVSNAILCSCYSDLLGKRAVKASAHFPVHNRPYLWDTGFQAIGVAPYAPKLALEMANLFFTDLDEDPPGLVYGTPLFVNLYAVWEVFQQTADVEMLKVLYPLMKRTYQWVAGSNGQPTLFDTLKLNAFCGFRQSYCPIGADDHPAANFNTAFADHGIELHPWARDASNRGDREKRTRGEAWYSDDVGIPGMTAHLIRYAQTLKNAAHVLGESGDLSVYDADIARFNRTLQQKMWDDATGYYAFTKGRDYRMVVDQTGTNFNMTFDGLMPLATHLCPKDRVAAMLENVRSPEHCWTEYGISNVDRSASYFKPDGYWNGTLWHPHQWFLWKALVDIDPALARKIALANLETAWKEHERDLRLCEHYQVENGQGHPCELASLNGPLAAWNATYHEPGRATVGYDTIVHGCAYDPAADRLTLRASAPFGPERVGVVACLKPNRSYRVSVLDGTVASSGTGDIAFTLPAPREPIEIVVQPAHRA